MWPRAGRYPVVLTVTDNDGALDRDKLWGGG